MAKIQKPQNLGVVWRLPESSESKSSGTRSQDWLCWRGPAAIYPNDRPIDKTLNSLKTQSKVVRQKNMVKGRMGPATNYDSASEGQEQFTRPNNKTPTGESATKNPAT
jgi:hypothetical protein